MYIAVYIVATIVATVVTVVAVVAEAALSSDQQSDPSLSACVSLVASHNYSGVANLMDLANGSSSTNKSKKLLFTATNYWQPPATNSKCLSPCWCKLLLALEAESQPARKPAASQTKQRAVLIRNSLSSCHSASFVCLSNFCLLRHLWQLFAMCVCVCVCLFQWSPAQIIQINVHRLHSLATKYSQSATHKRQ